MVVLKRAMKDGKEAALVVKHALKSNNIETRLLLDLLPNNGPLPTLQQIEQKMSLPRLLSLSNLAEQCKAANLKPLEVFTRSVQCTARRNAFGIVSIRSLAPDLSRDLQQLGAQQKLADLIVAYLQPLAQRQDEEGVNRRSNALEVCLNHMLPGSSQHFQSVGASDIHGDLPRLHATLCLLHPC